MQLSDAVDWKKFGNEGMKFKKRELTPGVRKLLADRGISPHDVDTTRIVIFRNQKTLNLLVCFRDGTERIEKFSQAFLAKQGLLNIAEATGES